jgi:hypothetical protein
VPHFVSRTSRTVKDPQWLNHLIPVPVSARFAQRVVYDEAQLVEAEAIA